MQNKRAKGKGKTQGEGKLTEWQRERAIEAELARARGNDRERTTFDCVKLYVMTPTASAPGTVLNRPLSPAPPLPLLLPLSKPCNRQLHMLIHSRIHTQRFTLGQRGRFHVQSDAAFHLTFVRGVGE